MNYPTLGIIPCLLLFTVLPACLHSQRTPVEKPFTKHYEKSNFEGLPYRLMAPIDTARQTKFPLVLSLHGGGGRGTDNIRSLVAESEILASEENRKQYPCYVLVPQSPRDSNWSFPDVLRPRMTKELLASYPKVYQNRFIARYLESDKVMAPAKLVPYGIGEMNKVMQLVEKLSKELPIDKNRIYVVGQSMGGAGTWEAIHKYPDFFAAAISSASILPPWMDPNKFKEVPIWLFHGKGDETVDYGCAIDAFARTQAIKANLKFTTLGNEPHGGKTRAIAFSYQGDDPSKGYVTQYASDLSDRTPNVWDWLFKQQK